MSLCVNVLIVKILWRFWAKLGAIPCSWEPMLDWVGVMAAILDFKAHLCQIYDNLHFWPS